MAITNGWARTSSSDKSAATIYVDIKNESATSDELVGLWTPAAESAVVMKPHWQGLKMTMERVTSLEVAPGGGIFMHPGGYQISLSGLRRTFHPGQTIPLELHFRNAGRTELSVAVSNKLIVSRKPDDKQQK